MQDLQHDRGHPKYTQSKNPPLRHVAALSNSITFCVTNTAISPSQTDSTYNKSNKRTDYFVSMVASSLSMFGVTSIMLKILHYINQVDSIQSILGICMTLHDTKSFTNWVTIPAQPLGLFAINASIAMLH